MIRKKSIKDKQNLGNTKIYEFSDSNFLRENSNKYP
jgi:hypothetical protein